MMESSADSLSVAALSAPALGVLAAFAAGAACAAAAVALFFQRRVTRLRKQIEVLRARLANEDDRINNARVLCEESLCAQHAQREFLTSISHDLRETLNSMDGVMREFMVRDDLDESQSEALAGLEEAREHLLAKMDDILVYAALEAGSLTHKESVFEPRAILRALEHRLRIALARKGAAVEWREESSLPRKVRGDAAQFLRCARALIAECRVWPHPAKIRVKVRWNDITGCIEIEAASLQAPEEQPLSAFLTAKEPSGTPSPGLLLAERIAKWAGGSMTLTSGSSPCTGTLLLEFPLKPEESSALTDQEKPPQEVTAKPAPPSDEPSLTILVVDDNDLNRRVLRHILRKAGWKCKEASSGEEALEFLAKEPFDVVLLDVEMPGLTGLDVVRILRERQPETERSFVMALTAYAQPEDRARCLEAGMDEHIPKPIDAVLLIDWMRRLQALPRHQRITLSASPRFAPSSHKTNEPHTPAAVAA